jgi:hypothetical protein
VEDFVTAAHTTALISAQAHYDTKNPGANRKR